MLNMVAIMGRLTAEPELRHTPSGISVTTFTVAVNRSYVKQGAERPTDFIDVVAWRTTAEFICKYFKKGQMIAIDGSIQTRTYVDKEEKKRKAFEILANNVYFTESKSSSSSVATSSTATEDRYQFAPPAEDDNLSFSAGEPDDFSVVTNDEDLPF